LIEVQRFSNRDGRDKPGHDEGAYIQVLLL
jgi:hypothetical protein